MEYSEKLTLCGSTRFRTAYEKVNRYLSLKGHVVYTVAFFPNGGDTLGKQQKERLDLVHKAKIDNSDGIVVLDVDGYIGESTKSEIEYANLQNKHVWYLSADPELFLLLTETETVYIYRNWLEHLTDQLKKIDVISLYNLYKESKVSPPANAKGLAVDGDPALKQLHNSFTGLLHNAWFHRQSDSSCRYYITLALEILDKIWFYSVPQTETEPQTQKLPHHQNSESHIH